MHKNGYSGVATYTRAATVVPLKAEEGITGLSHATPVEGQRRNVKQPKLILSQEERVSSLDSSYPGLYGVADDSDDEDGVPNSAFGIHSVTDLKALDSEGRTLVLDFGLFVLINVYCPNDGSADEADSNNRIQFKTDFHNVLEARIRSLLREGREVILVGDLNACASINDHCEGDILVKRVMKERESNIPEIDVDPEEIFWEEKQSRRWLRDLVLGDKKCFVDVTRMYHPERKGMYTCGSSVPVLKFGANSVSTGWNTKISARESNYGTRIDYILVTPGLLPWINFSDIQPQIKGSDHCPVFVDFHEEREVDGRVIRLRDLMVPPITDTVVPTTRDPPRLAARFWDEYSGKQRLLDSFFKGAGVKKKSLKEQTSPSSPSELPPSEIFASQTSTRSTSVASDPSSTTVPSSSQESSSETTLKRPRSLSPDVDTLPKASSSSSTIPGTQNKKVKKDASLSSISVHMSASGTISKKSSVKSKDKDTKPQRLKPGQAKLSSFFAVPASDQVKGKQKNSTARVSANTKGEGKGKAKAEEIDLTADDIDMDTADPIEGSETEKANQEDSDYRLALSLSQESISSFMPVSSSSSKTGKSSAAWKTLLTKPPAPRCTVHNEEAKEFRVNKPGPNKGRVFWVCSRPVGPGYDKGRTDRPREEVDPQWKCNFFMWASDLKKETSK
ncbi:Class II abasic (AP) endonuclease [Stygiomarasmius scandens]|uniref:DNA-(apurinic or apyrimidinic site) endonuclease 2 n=1 Tax=Marasmiellus scandens TaxID=2682957 RepID=A0ABR1JC77_9AGAR